MVDYEPLCWSLAAIMLSCVAVFGLTLSHKWSAENRTTEEFLTARGKVTSMWRLAWSFYAGAVGAWVVASPSSYASFAGMIGLIFYALACGMPFLVIAFAGPVIQRRLPNVTSLAEYMGHRFGAYSQIYVALIVLLNMAVATIVEYITIGTLFEVYLGSTGWPMVVVIGMLTLFYTTWGGLLVSIATDQVQGICSFFLVVFVFFYLVATFQEDLPRPMPSYIAGTTEYGYSAIFTMPLSLFVGTTFSEAMWQRAWAAASPRKLQVAAALGGAGVVLVVLVSGLCGWLAAWAGLLDSYPNPNLYMFYGLRGTVDEATGNIANWFGVLALLLAAMMCCGAVDSFQNGFLAAFNGLTSVAIKVLDAKRPGTFPPGYQVPLKWTRLAVVALNVPLIALGAAGSKEEWAVLDFFLITNMLGTTAAAPVFAGLSSRLRPYFGGTSFHLSWFLSFFLTSLYGVAECWGDALAFDYDLYAYTCTPAGASGGESFRNGMAFAWYRNGYQWKYFAVALGTSLGAVGLCTAINYLVIGVLGRERGLDRQVYGFVGEAEVELKQLPADCPQEEEEGKAAGPVDDVGAAGGATAAAGEAGV